MIEKWKNVKGYEGKYQVSNMGRVRSVTRKLPHKRLGSWVRKGVLLKQETMKGYLYTDTNHQGLKKKHAIHRLVALAFIPNIEEKPFVNHKDADKKNNRKENLEWVTAKENSKHAQGLDLFRRGQEHAGAKFSDDEVRKIRKDFAGGEISQKDMAKRYGVHRATIGRIIQRKLWRHI